MIQKQAILSVCSLKLLIEYHKYIYKYNFSIYRVIYRQPSEIKLR